MFADVFSLCLLSHQLFLDYAVGYVHAVHGEVVVSGIFQDALSGRNCLLGVHVEEGTILGML